MTRWKTLAALAAVLAIPGGCGKQAVDRNGTPSLSVAEAALQGGSDEVALQVANGILSSYGGNAEALCVKGDALTGLGRMQEAKASYDAAMEADPGSTRARLGLGRLRLATDPAGAEALFLEVLQHDTRNAVAFSDLGIARDLQGRHADAQQAYRQALGINPELTAAQVNLALSMAISGDGPGAARLIKPIATAPSASRKLRHDYAAVLALSGDPTEAERVLAPDLSPGEIHQFLEAIAAGGATHIAAPIAVVRLPQVQLAAAETENMAQAEWQRLQERFPAVLAGHHPLVIKIDQAGHTFWRLRVADFADGADATAFCQQLRVRNAACVVLGP
jgi:Flp pilus assembly protein TadD